MADRIPLETAFHFQAIRSEIRQAGDLDQLRAVALKAVDLMETQRQVVAEMLQANYLPGPQLPPRGER
jgi:hypothetical protein